LADPGLNDALAGDDDVANEAGARQALIRSLEAGGANPTLESLDKIAGALGVRLAELLAEK
jgi:DNA-binding phage protein